MAWWFKKKRPEVSQSGSGQLNPKDEEEYKIAEEAITRFKKHASRLKENLELLQAETVRNDLAHLAAVITTDINEILALLEKPVKQAESGEDVNASKYAYKRYIVPKEEDEDELPGRKMKEDPETAIKKNEESLDLTFHPETLPEAREAEITSKKSILLVEDNEDLLAFYCLALSPYYEILEAGNGAEGLKIAVEVSPDLIVSDLMMPLMDGIELCKAIKNDISTNHIPFIILTAKDAVASRLEGVQSGADVYLAKPASAELLYATIENIFLQRQKIKDYFSKKHYSEALSLVNSTSEQEFISRVIEIIDHNLTNTDFDVDRVCRELGLSRSRLYLKIKNLTGQSIIEFVRSYRLKKAREIMTHEHVSLTEVIYRVGIQTPSYFTKAFKKEFGQTPSGFLEELKKLK